MVLHLGMTSQGEHEPESHIRGYTTLDQPWSLNPQIQTRVTLTSNFFEAVLAWPLSEHQAPCEEPSMRQSTWILFRVLGPWDIRRLSGLGCRGFQALHQPKHAAAILLNSIVVLLAAMWTLRARHCSKHGMRQASEAESKFSRIAI